MHYAQGPGAIVDSEFDITANSNTMGPYSTHMDAEFDAGFIVK